MKYGIGNLRSSMGSMGMGMGGGSREGGHASLKRQNSWAVSMSKDVQAMTQSISDRIAHKASRAKTHLGEMKLEMNGMASGMMKTHGMANGMTSLKTNLNTNLAKLNMASFVSSGSMPPSAAGDSSGGSGADGSGADGSGADADGADADGGSSKSATVNASASASATINRLKASQ
jgi:hypothetical protein